MPARLPLIAVQNSCCWQSEWSWRWLGLDPWLTLAVAVALPGAGLALAAVALRCQGRPPRWLEWSSGRCGLLTLRLIRRWRGPRWLEELAVLPRWHSYRDCFVAAMARCCF